METMIGNMKEDKTQFVRMETGQKRTLANPTEEHKQGEAIDLKSIHTLYINKCKDCDFTLNHRVSKIFIGTKFLFLFACFIFPLTNWLYILFAKKIAKTSP